MSPTVHDVRPAGERDPSAAAPWVIRSRILAVHSGPRLPVGPCDGDRAHLHRPPHPGKSCMPEPAPSSPTPGTGTRRAARAALSSPPVQTRRDRRRRPTRAARTPRHAPRRTLTRSRMLAGAVMLPVASIAGLPLLIPLTPEPVFAVEATRTPVRAQSFTTPDTVTGTVMVRGDYTVAVTPPSGPSRTRTPRTRSPTTRHRRCSGRSPWECRSAARSGTAPRHARPAQISMPDWT